MTETDLSTELEQARADYAQLRGRGLKLDLTRGKPSSAQLDLSDELLSLPGNTARSADGTDTRNYGGLNGLLELREIFSQDLQVPAKNLLALGSSSLNVMHDVLINALLSPLPGAARRWVEEPDIAVLCPVPGYDRHFALAGNLGFRLIPVPMTPAGPDMDEVERLVAADARIKAIWCVPKYSNPDGVTYSDEVVQRLAAMSTAAPDFRVFWDNAYAVHHLTDTPDELADLFQACADAGHPDRVFVFGSTSKITLAGAGVSFLGTSDANLAWLLGRFSKSTIGPDKVNQLRHAQFLQSPDGLGRAHEEARGVDQAEVRCGGPHPHRAVEWLGTGHVDDPGGRLFLPAHRAARNGGVDRPGGQRGGHRAHAGWRDPPARSGPHRLDDPHRAHVPRSRRGRSRHRRSDHLRPADRTGTVGGATGAEGVRLRLG